MNPTAPTTDPLPAQRRPRGRPRKTDDERDDGNRRQDLLRAAAHLFRQQGYDATSTRDIASAAGMRSGSPFYHFESKQALLAAVMEEGMQRALALQSQALVQVGAASEARDRLRLLVRRHLDVLLGPQSDFVPVMLYEWRSLSDRQREDILRLRQSYEAAWMPVLAQLHAQGALRGDPGLVRLMVFGALNWTVQWYDPQRTATLDDLTDTAMALFLSPSTVPDPTLPTEQHP